MMRRKKNGNNIKKNNFALKRKITLIYSRILLVIKVTMFIFICLFFFTEYFSSIKFKMIQNIYQLTANIGFTLKNVIIEGQHNVRESDILASLNINKRSPIFSFNLGKIKYNLESNPWIKSVFVGRRLPDSIYINILERTPIAIWQINQKLFLIDKNGYKITSNVKQFSSLPHVVGIDANIYANELIEDLAKYPELAKKIISSVRYGERRWNLNFEQNITIKMPESGFAKALSYIAKLNKANKLFNQNYKIIDLRDDSKYYIEKF